MRELRWLAAFAFVWIIPASAWAQTARHVYDIASYDLNIRPDFDTGRISLHATVLIVNTATSDTFRFGLSARYERVAVRVNGSPAALVRAGDTIAVGNPDRAPSVELRFDLEGAPGRSEDEDRPVIDNDSLFLLWSDRFYPIDFADWATVRIAVFEGAARARRDRACAAC